MLFRSLVGDTTRNLESNVSWETPGASGLWVQDVDQDGSTDFVLSVADGKALRGQESGSLQVLSPTGTSGVMGW